MPDPIPNTITTLPNQTLDTGSYITWECSDGYMMDGLTNTAVWVCLEDGSNWLGHSPICKGNRFKMEIIIFKGVFCTPGSNESTVISCKNIFLIICLREFSRQSGPQDSLWITSVIPVKKHATVFSYRISTRTKTLWFFFRSGIEISCMHTNLWSKINVLCIVRYIKGNHAML